MPPIIDKGTCDACGICVNICPTDVYFGSQRREVPVVAYPNECWHCNACVHDCPRGSIRLRVPLPWTMVQK